MSTTHQPVPSEHLRIFAESALATHARYQREPDEEHKAAMERAAARLKLFGGLEAVGKDELDLAQKNAARELELDELAKRCLCGQCGRAVREARAAELLGANLPRYIREGYERVEREMVSEFGDAGNAAIQVVGQLNALVTP